MSESFQHTGPVVLALKKATDELGLVFGIAIACTVGGEPYVDLDDHHIPDDVMLKGALDFAKNRSSKVMHEGENVGEVVFMWPLTKEVAEAFDLEAPFTGLLVAVQPSDDETLEKYKSGELPAFSIAGTGVFE